MFLFKILLSQTMKSSSHIVFRLLFLLTVFFCLVLEAYAFDNIPICNTELSSDQKCKDNSVFSYADSFEDDHINQVHAPFYFVKQLLFLSISNYSYLAKEFTLSNWKPPKYS